MDLLDFSYLLNLTTNMIKTEFKINMVAMEAVVWERKTEITGTPI